MFPQHVDVVAVVVFHPFVFGNLMFKMCLVGALVEPLDPPMLELTLSNQW